MPDVERGPVRLPLGGKLALALAAAAAGVLGFLFLGLGPSTESGFLTSTSKLLESGREAMQNTARERTFESGELLREVIRHTADGRRRSLADLPMSLYDGDVEGIRRAIEGTDAQRTERLIDNVEILAVEMERRSDRRIEEDLRRLAAEQAALGRGFAAEVRRSTLWLTTGLLAALLVLLGLGLDRAVVRPVRALRRATQAAARGELDTAVAVRSKDEVGALAEDFENMLAQLRESRRVIAEKNRELEEWNRRLGSEVTRKTEHLERALEDLRSTQRQLLHSAKMASLGTLSRGVAHEFNNLIGGIRGCATEAIESEDRADRREVLEVIRRAADRGAEITRQLLHFSRDRVGSMQDADVSRPVLDALRLVEPEARRRGVRIETEVQGGLVAHCDRDSLHQVFLNLYTNALQAMPEGGCLRVTASRTPSEVKVLVEDDGVGIPAEDLDRIFDPFFTSKDQEEDPAARGSGLGLSVSYGILEAHAGTLEVSSEPGRGTTVRVTLPIRPPLLSPGASR